MTQLVIYFPGEAPIDAIDEDESSYMDEASANWDDPDELRYIEQQMYRDLLDAETHHETNRAHEMRLAIRRIGARINTIAH